MIIYGKTEGVPEGKGKGQANNGIYKHNNKTWKWQNPEQHFIIFPSSTF